MTTPLDQPASVEAVSPLTPMQQGMLFQSLLDPSSRAYLVQIRCTLDGPLDAAALRASWQGVVDRHAVLRTAFAWQRAEGSVQITWSRATVPWCELDWGDERPERVEPRLEEWLDADRARGFDLARAPLVRLTLVRLTEQRHVLVWTMHHIILDGWSVARLLDEVTAAYGARAAPAPLAAPKPRPFGDFVRWQAGQPRDGAEMYWRDALRGVDEASSPFGRPLPATRAPEPRDVIRSLDRTRTAALIGLAEHARVTLATAALGAWCLVLGRVSGRRDVITGVTAAVRPPEFTGVESMVGLFINTLPLRASVEERMPVAEWLRELQGRAVALREHAHVSLVDVQEWSGLARTTPLFDHLFVFENYPVSGAAGHIGNLAISDVRSVEPTEYPLTIVVVPGEELAIQFAYDAARVDAADVERLADQFVTLLSSLPRGPELPLWQHAALTATERVQVTTGWNATAREWAGTVVPHEIFERQVAATPTVDAIVFGEASLSYAELNDRANRLAHRLIALGAGTETNVGIFMNRSLDMAVAVLAVLKAGAAYVPLDPAYPTERLAFMAADGELVVLVTERALRDNAPRGARATVIVDVEWDDVARYPATSPGVHVDPEHPLYVIYTSGSTGRPKGIVLSHGALGNLVRWHAETLRPAPHMLQFASLSFDASFHELFAAWATGGCVYLITDEQRRDVDALLAVVASHPIDRVILPVVVLQRWAAEHGDDVAPFANLREIITTGEQLQITQPIVRLLRQLPAATLMNHYGPAETHVITAHTLSDDRAAWPTYPPVGAPVANSQAYVLDEWLSPAPVGVAGELYLGGANLARGYARRPGLTAQKFVPNPFGAPGARLYKTGDQARWLRDGSLEYLGRLDLMVKIRGNRVELGEVEAALGDHPAVGSCAVAVHERTPGDKRLVAYCVPTEHAVVDGPTLRAHLAARLPDYMLPSTFVALEAMPLTPNGKIDRRALPLPNDQDVQSGERIAPPRDLVEDVLSRAWSEVLGVRRVGVHDDFFALGGHSLTAVQVLARVRRAFGVVPPLRALFEHPVLGAFAAEVRAAMGQPVMPNVPIEALGAFDPNGAQLSPAQERLYFLQRLDPGSSAYNLGGRLRLDGPLDGGALERALRDIMERHAVLRTLFVRGDGAGRALAQPSERFTLRRVDLSILGAAAESEMDRFCRTELARPFDLEGELPLRASLVVLASDRHVLSLTLHHIAGDGGSIDVFVRELAALYAAAREGRSAPLDTPTLQYADLAAHLRARDSATAADDVGLTYWRETLAALEPLDLPTDRPRPAVPRHRGASIVWSFAGETSVAIDAAARAAGSSPSVICLAAFGELLRRYGRTRDVAIAMPVSLRDRVELEEMIGLLLNTVVVRLRAGDRDETIRASLDAARVALLDAYAYRDVPFERVVDALRPARERARAPLAQVMFDYHAWRQDDLVAGDVRFSLEEVGVGTTKFDLTLVVERRDSGFVASLEYDTDLFDAATAEAMRQHYDVLLAAFAGAPAAALATVEMTGGDERARLGAWGDPVQGAEAPASILPLLDRAWRRAPDAVALSDDRGKLSYSEFAARVDGLAAQLHARGVCAGTVVAVDIGRSRELVIALLAVLRCGGAFVPLDPEAPAAHRRAILDDAAPLVMLTAADVVDATDGASVRAEAPPAADVAGDDLAYILYTSGSTGRPKGCQISHRALAAYVTWAARQYVGDTQEVGDCALFTAPTFDLTITSLLLPLVCGRTLTVLPQDAPVGALLSRAFRSANLVKLTPSHVALLAGEPPHPDVRVIVVGGEALTVEQVRALGRVAPNAAIYNEYGPTEATVGCVVARVTGADDRILIGRPVDHAHVALVDAAGRLVPAGVFGELLVGGPSLARGYAARPALTAAAFVPDIHSRERGARLYRTGDLARWTRSGALEYGGRLDDQLKIRGHRVEPSEVAAALETHPDVLRAVVVGDPAGASAERLLAYCETRVAVDPVSLRDRVASRLPSYMVPARFVCMDELPINAHGKLDRRALPTLDRATATSAAAATPRNVAERTLVEVWSDLLHLDTVGIDDNFFELGGDSIVSMQLVSRAAQRGLAITVDDIFRHQTIAGIAAAASAADPGGAVRVVDGAPAAGALTASAIQEWFFSLALPKPEHFNQAVLLAVRGADASAIEAALGDLRAHHDALRLTAREAHGAWRLEVQPPDATVPVRLNVEDISHLAAASRSAEIERRAAAVQASIDLAQGPPFVAALFLCGHDEPARLLLAVHHLAVDGVSWRILLEDLETAYAARRRGEHALLPPTTVSLRDWSERRAHTLAAADAGAELSFWSSQERGSALSADHPHAEDVVADEREIVVELEPAETLALTRVLSRDLDARVDDALLAALAAAVSLRCPGGLVVDVETHGRDALPGVDASRVVGWFTALYPVALPREGSSPIAELLRATRQRARAAAQHGSSFGELRYRHPDLAVRAAMEAIEPRDVLFTYHGKLDLALGRESAGAMFGVAPESPGPEKDPGGRRSHPVEITGSIVDERLRLVWAYGGRRFEDGTIRALADAQRDALRALIATADAPGAQDAPPQDTALLDDELAALEAELLG